MTDPAETKTDVVVAETKGALTSKISLVGILLVVLSAVNDPMFGAYFGQWVPQEWITRISFLSGWAIIYFRGNGANNMLLDWRNPWKGVSDQLVANTTEPGKATVSEIVRPVDPK